MRARAATDLQAAQESSAPPPSPIRLRFPGEPVGQALPQASDVRLDTQTHRTALVSVGQRLPGSTLLSHDERTTGKKSQNLVLVGEGQSPRYPPSPWCRPTRGRPSVWRGLWREGGSCPTCEQVGPVSEALPHLFRGHMGLLCEPQAEV